MATFLTADWHLGETRLELMQRPFETTEDMASILLSNHNKLVKPDDELIIVGDICVDPAWLTEIKWFNGRKTLIRGNHDRRFTDKELEPYFERIVAEGDGIELEIENIPLWLTHYPTRSRSDRFNLVGHIHSAWKVQLNMLNCGVDVHSFQPLALDRVPFFLAAIKSFYDDDVWVADHPANAPFKGRRGKPGSYLS